MQGWRWEGRIIVLGDGKVTSWEDPIFSVKEGSVRTDAKLIIGDTGYFSQGCVKL